MGAYPTDGGMKDVLLAMKQKAAQNTDRLRYMDDYRITTGGYWPPFNKRTMYFVPLGTAREYLGENLTGLSYRYTHRVRIECVYHTYEPVDTEKAIIGTSAEVGLCDMVADTLSYFSNNWLGLAGLDKGIPPECVEDEDTYVQISPEDQSIYFNVGRVIYEATTKAHERPTDT